MVTGSAQQEIRARNGAGPTYLAVESAKSLNIAVIYKQQVYSALQKPMAAKVIMRIQYYLLINYPVECINPSSSVVEVFFFFDANCLKISLPNTGIA